MAPYLIALLALQLFQTASWAKVARTSHYDLGGVFDTYSDFFLSPFSELSNDIDDKGDLFRNNNGDSSYTDANSAFGQTVDDDFVLQFRLPIKGAHVDHLRNAVVLKFQGPNRKILNNMDPDEFKRLRDLQENSMRLGKRVSEKFPRSNQDAEFFAKNPNPERNHQVVRDVRGDNFMRFGRSASAKGNKDFMRFGRAGGNDDFMRFGRASGQDFMRFGRSMGQDFMRFDRDPGQDFMRFGRAAGQDFLRFGRDPGLDFMRFERDPGQDFLRFGRDSNQDFMRFGRSAGQDFMRFGRFPEKDFMRFSRNPSQDFMRFGRAGRDFIRFGRDPNQDFIRFGGTPNEDFMRFGRAPPSQDFMRFGRSWGKDLEKNNFARYSRPDNFMRFGRAPPQPADFMRFGKSPQKSENQTQSVQSRLSKNELKQAVKLIHEADSSADRGGNPVDRAIKVLFDKHQQQDQQRAVDEQSGDSTQHEDSGDVAMDMDYTLKITK